MIIDSNIQIPFHPIDLDDMWWYKAREKEDDVQACDSIFGSIFLWSKAYYTEVHAILYRVSRSTVIPWAEQKKTGSRLWKYY